MQKCHAEHAFRVARDQDAAGILVSGENRPDQCVVFIPLRVLDRTTPVWLGNIFRVSILVRPGPRFPLFATRRIAFAVATQSPIRQDLFP
jgi:hypothetical protein